MKRALQERAALYFILIDDVAITHLTFTDRFLAAVEAKQTAEQDAERVRYLVEQAVQEKKSIIVQAEGESVSAELIGKTMNPMYLELKRVEGSKKVAEILSEANNRAFIDVDTLLMNLVTPMQAKLLKLNNFDKVKV
eukprot:TRINITY_DN4145_c0_g1_i2.p2 TRINITY_DN4145_c0_g1~~TRINITY_DN4145_c0_g1_i2.p2  ORF type:complete len:137 (+),score=52.87 TRINITY_DN4145_c0_g1_i2:607-1017(+)